MTHLIYLTGSVRWVEKNDDATKKKKENKGGTDLKRDQVTVRLRGRRAMPRTWVAIIRKRTSSYQKNKSPVYGRASCFFFCVFFVLWFFFFGGVGASPFFCFFVGLLYKPCKNFKKKTTTGAQAAQVALI